MRSGPVISDLRRGQDRLRDLADFLFLAHRRRAQQHVGFVFGQPLQLHEDALGAIDHLAVFKRRSGAVEFILQLREGVEARNAEVEDRLDAFLLQSVDDIGGDAGIDGCLYRRRVALIDEHRNRPAHGRRELLSQRSHTALQLTLVFGAVEVALRGGDESIRADLPDLEATDANFMPGAARSSVRAD